jgi:hypothetical protein
MCFITSYRSDPVLGKIAGSLPNGSKGHNTNSKLCQMLGCGFLAIAKSDPHARQKGRGKGGETRLLHNTPRDELSGGGEDLVDDDSAHEDKIEAEGPEQEHFRAGELSAPAVMFFFFGDELVGFEGGDDGGEVGAPAG